MVDMDKTRIRTEVRLKGIRSSGAGGQHVNKVSSKMELTFDVANSLGLTSSEKDRIYRKLGNRISKDKILQLQCDTARSQHKNRELVIARLIELLNTAIKVPKKRKRTGPTRTAVEKRLKAKRIGAEKKISRKKPDSH